MSTHDDVLARATAAARSVCDQAAPPRRATRDAVLARALEKRRGARRAAVLTPLLAATLVCSTAWAATTGRLTPVATWWHARFAVHAPAAQPARRSVRLAPSPVALPVAIVPAADPLPVAPAALAAAAAHTEPPARAPRAATGSHAEPSEALYAAAHRAHFGANDPAAALAAWDAYLRASPHGRFAPEARYNRAIDLIHLGRDDEARAALRPFVEGRADAYRRTEAQRLLDALDAP